MIFSAKTQYIMVYMVRQLYFKKSEEKMSEMEEIHRIRGFSWFRFFSSIFIMFIHSQGVWFVFSFRIVVLRIVVNCSGVVNRSGQQTTVRDSSNIFIIQDNNVCSKVFDIRRSVCQRRSIFLLFITILDSKTVPQRSNTLFT